MPTNNHLTQLLRDNPNIQLAYITHEQNASALILHQTEGTPVTALRIPSQLADIPAEIKPTQPITTLRLPATRHDALNKQQLCQNEPIQLGTQCQPAGAQWLGTAGAPCHWLDSQSHDVYGVLSNWHVIADGTTGPGHPQHQPDDRSPAFAHLSDAQPVSPTETNYVDGAIADAMIDGLHTIDKRIIEVGTVAPDPAQIAVGLSVKKSGRTTGLTHGKVSAIGASARVSYGGFTATFEDQIIVTDVGGSFSAAGDSGSFVVCTDANRPVGLLFAGGGGTTVLNPIHRVMDRFQIDFRF